MSYSERKASMVFNDSSQAAKGRSGQLRKSCSVKLFIHPAFGFLLGRVKAERKACGGQKAVFAWLETFGNGVPIFLSVK